MDPNSILAKTAKGIAAKPEDLGVNYDGVRLLRQINGKASIAELRPGFQDLTDGRFEKALVMLQRNGLVHMLEVSAQAASAETHGLDAQMQEVEKEVLQTLDFSGLQRTLLDAMRAPAAATDKPARASSMVKPAAAPHIARVRADTTTEIRIRTQKQRLAYETELRAQLAAELRPKVEEELRSKLAGALRPALEAEIRTKLIAALKPRVELELRTRLKTQLEQAAESAALPAQIVFDCLPVAAFQNDLAGKNMRVNAAWSTLTGANSADTAGKPFTHLFAEGDRKTLGLYLDRVARGRQSDSGWPAHLQRWIGGPLKVLLRAAPLTNTAGETTGVCGILFVPDAEPPP